MDDIFFTVVTVFVFMCLANLAVQYVTRRVRRKRETAERELGIVYDRLVDGAFPPDEQVSKKEFTDYFLRDRFRKHHHIEYDGDFTYYLAWNDLPNCNAVCIQALVVDKKLRNRGRGSEVFHNWFYETGNPNVVIEVDNEGARRFWEREGFVVNDRHEHFQPRLGEGKKPVAMPLAFNFDVDTDDIPAIEKDLLKYGFGITDGSPAVFTVH